MASRLYAPYGTSRYSNGVMPGSFGFTGQRSDTNTGLDYYGFRYYDPQAGQFASADSAQSLNGYDPWGLSRYAYVHNNPETKTDPDGHCWPICTVLAGAAIGAVIGAATSVVTQVASGKPVDWGQVGKEAAVGAVSGAVTGLAGPGAGVLAHAAIGAAAGAAGQVVSNALDHKPLGDGVLVAAGVGALTGGATGGVGKLLARGGSAAESKGVGKAAGAVCKLSFAPETPVTTPTGAQPIVTLHVGDEVEAYDPATGQASTQTVEQVWINHDNDLIDLTLRSDADAGSQPQPADVSTKQQDAAVASHGTRTPPTTAGEAARPSASGDEPGEIIHTTSEHPWLTADRGWVAAGDLHVGERVRRLDGSSATIADVDVVPGVAAMYDLTVSQLHTFAVGAGRYVVHNTNVCGLPLSLQLADGMAVSITAKRLEHSFTSAVRRGGRMIGHAEEWFGRQVSKEADMPAWKGLIQKTTNSKIVFNSTSRGAPTRAVLARLSNGSQMRYFVAHFYRDSGELATAFAPSRRLTLAYLRTWRAERAGLR